MIRKWCNQKENPTPNTEVKKRLNKQLGIYTKKTYRKPSEQLFLNRWTLSHPNLKLNMKTHIRCKQHKNQHQDIEIIRITIEVSPWNNQYYKNTGELKLVYMVIQDMICPSWLCDLDYLFKLCFPIYREASYERPRVFKAYFGLIFGKK